MQFGMPNKMSGTGSTMTLPATPKAASNVPSARYRTTTRRRANCASAYENPATTIRRVASIATDVAASLNPSTSVVTLPPIPKAGSRAPLPRYRATAISPLLSAAAPNESPATTILPSACTAIAAALSRPENVVVTLPSPSKLGSSCPGCASASGAHSDNPAIMSSRTTNLRARKRQRQNDERLPVIFVVASSPVRARH